MGFKVRQKVDFQYTDIDGDILDVYLYHGGISPVVSMAIGGTRLHVELEDIPELCILLKRVAASNGN